MTALLSALLVIGIAAAAAWVCRRPATAEDWMPRELCGARLVYAERLFRSQAPPVAAKVDRVYRCDGRLMLVELKTRAGQHVHASDVIELSAQRVAVESETGEQVADVAWVLMQRLDGSARVVRPVALMSREHIRAMVLRRERLLAGHLEAARCRNARLCETCGLRRECDENGDLASTAFGRANS
jgi:hypothetical protein